MYCSLIPTRGKVCFSNIWSFSVISAGSSVSIEIFSPCILLDIGVSSEPSDAAVVGGGGGGCGGGSGGCDALDDLNIVSVS
jgi:hypothetical protein